MRLLASSSPPLKSSSGPRSRDHEAPKKAVKANNGSIYDSHLWFFFVGDDVSDILKWLGFFDASSPL